MVTISTKVCPKCGQEKELDEFGLNKTTKDGRQTYCKQCQLEYNKKYYENKKLGKNAPNIVKTVMEKAQRVNPNISSEDIIPSSHNGDKIRFSPLEEQFLKNNANIMDIKEIAKQLNRSIDSIKQKMYKLGLKKPEPATPLDPKSIVYSQFGSDIAGIKLILSRVEKRLSSIEEALIN